MNKKNKILISSLSAIIGLGAVGVAVVGSTSTQQKNNNFSNLNKINSNDLNQNSSNNISPIEGNNQIVRDDEMNISPQIIIDNNEKQFNLNPNDSFLFVSPKIRNVTSTDKVNYQWYYEISNEQQLNKILGQTNQDLYLDLSSLNSDATFKLFLKMNVNGTDYTSDPIVVNFKTYVENENGLTNQVDTSIANKIVIDDTKLADAINNELIKAINNKPINIDHDIDIQTLSDDGLRQQINKRVNINDLINDLNKRMHDHGINESINPGDITFKIRQKPALFALDDPELNENVKDKSLGVEKYDVDVMYRDAIISNEPISIQNSISSTNTNTCTLDEVAQTFNKLLNKQVIDGYNLNKNYDELTSTELTNYIFGYTNADNIIENTNVYFEKNDLTNHITRDNIVFSGRIYCNDNTTLQIFVQVKDNKNNLSTPVKTPWVINSVYKHIVHSSNEKVSVPTMPTDPIVAEPADPVKVLKDAYEIIKDWKFDSFSSMIGELLSQADLTSTYRVIMTNCDAVGGLTKPKMIVRFHKNLVNTKLHDHAYFRVTAPYGNVPNFYDLKIDKEVYEIPSEVLDRPGLYSVDMLDNVYGIRSQSVKLYSNPLEPTKLYVSNDGQFTRDNDKVTVSTTILNDAMVDLGTLNKTQIDWDTLKIYWYDEAHNEIVSNKKSFDLYKTDVKEEMRLKLILTAKAKSNTNWAVENGAWEDLSYVSPEFVSVLPYDPSNPDGIARSHYQQSYAIKVSIDSDKNIHYIDTFDDYIKLNAKVYNIQPSYKLSWFKDGEPINGSTNLSISDSDLSIKVNQTGNYQAVLYDEYGNKIAESKDFVVENNPFSDIQFDAYMDGQPSKTAFTSWDDMLTFKYWNTESLSKYIVEPGSMNFVFYDKNTKEVFRDPGILATRYDHDLDVKFAVTGRIWNYDLNNFEQITYAPKKTIHISKYNYDSKLIDDDQANPIDKNVVDTIRWSNNDAYGIEDDKILLNKTIQEVNDNDLNGSYVLKHAFVAWTKIWINSDNPLYKELKEQNIIFRIIEKDPLLGQIAVQLGFAKNSDHIAWSPIPFMLTNFAVANDKEIANAIVAHNQSVIPVGMVSILDFKDSYVNIHNVDEINTYFMPGIKRYKIGLYTTFEERKYAYDHYEENGGTLKVHLTYNGTEADDTITVQLYKGTATRENYYTDQENADYFAEINKDNHNILTNKMLFAGNITNNTINIDDLYVNTHFIPDNNVTGFYIGTTYKYNFSFVVDQQAINEAKTTGEIKAKVKYGNAISHDYVTIRGLLKYDDPYDINAKYEPYEAANLFTKWNSPGGHGFLVFNSPEIYNAWVNEWDDAKAVRLINELIDDRSSILWQTLVNKDPYNLLTSNVCIKITQVAGWGRCIGVNIRFGYRQDLNSRIFWADDDVMIEFYNDPSIQFGTMESTIKGYGFCRYN